MTNNQFLTFTGDEILSDVMGIIPEASDILLSHGLGCVECHFNAFETIEQGFIGHGFSQEELDSVLKDLNEAAHDLQIPPDAFLHHME